MEKTSQGLVHGWLNEPEVDSPPPPQPTPDAPRIFPYPSFLGPLNQAMHLSFAGGGYIGYMARVASDETASSWALVHAGNGGDCEHANIELYAIMSLTEKKIQPQQGADPQTREKPWVVFLGVANSQVREQYLIQAIDKTAADGRTRIPAVVYGQDTNGNNQLDPEEKAAGWEVVPPPIGQPYAHYEQSSGPIEIIQSYFSLSGGFSVPNGPVWQRLDPAQTKPADKGFILDYFHEARWRVEQKPNHEGQQEPILALYEAFYVLDRNTALTPALGMWQLGAGVTAVNAQGDVIFPGVIEPGRVVYQGAGKTDLVHVWYENALNKDGAYKPYGYDYAATHLTPWTGCPATPASAYKPLAAEAPVQLKGSPGIPAPL